MMASSVRPDAMRLRAKMTAQRLGKQQLARIAGVSDRTVERLRQGGATTVWTLDRVACALGCHMSELECDGS